MLIVRILFAIPMLYCMQAAESSTTYCPGTSKDACVETWLEFQPSSAFLAIVITMQQTKLWQQVPRRNNARELNSTDAGDAVCIAADSTSFIITAKNSTTTRHSYLSTSTSTISQGTPSPSMTTSATGTSVAASVTVQTSSKSMGASFSVGIGLRVARFAAESLVHIIWELVQGLSKERANKPVSRYRCMIGKRLWSSDAVAES
ncbi:hypothetical protein BP6252_14089 [Coleophoma cylindrospora]|uniref:Uncharacterized protein n=1 Tax=Coleophoma cylindrospora TaxID=1849047 RepID=A0A3D8Q3X8_9HELO|nr:hypothetical protein BP6252_14089 [Coleophoma cylindrospora]